jgi:hypothetical protein
MIIILTKMLDVELNASSNIASSTAPLAAAIRRKKKK